MEVKNQIVELLQEITDKKVLEFILAFLKLQMK